MQRASSTQKHIELERWGPPPVDADWHAFCHTIAKELKETNGKSCTIFF